MSTTTRDPDAVLDEGPALALGVVWTIVAAFLAFAGVGQLNDIFADVVKVLIPLWLVGSVLYIMSASSWKDGLTLQEVFNAIAWPYGFYKAYKGGQRIGNFRGTNVPAHEDNSPVLISSEQVAHVVCWAVTILVFITFGFFVISTALSVGWTLAWMLVMLWPAGSAYTFWSTKAYTGGLTQAEMIQCLTVWPVQLYKRVHTSISTVRNRPAVTP